MNTDHTLIEQLTSIAEVNPPISVASISDATRVSFISMADVSESGRLLQKQERFLREVKVGFTRFAEGDILFAKITPCMENGKGALARGLTNGLGFGSTEFHVLRAKVNGEAEFIYQILQSREFRIKAEGRMTGSAGQKRVPADVFDWYRTFIPSLPEQRKIAKILTTVDAVIEKTKAAIEKYKAIKQGMMHDLFTRGLDENGKLRPRYEDAPHLYKKNDLGWVPKQWELNPLISYLKYISYGFTNPMPEAEEGPYIVTAANIFGGKIQYHTARRTSISAFDNLLTDKSKPKINDVLLTKDGTLGRLALVDRDNICINQSVAIMRCKENYDPEFIKVLLETPNYQKKMSDDAGGSTIKHIYITKIDKMRIATPKKIDEQYLIKQRILSMDKKIDLEENALSKLYYLKHGLMQDLLTGKKRVRVEDNTTSA
jgi:type I restriction enzyme S subunit